MSDTIRLIQNNTGPNIDLALKDGPTGTAIDITGFTSGTLKFRAIGTTLVLATLTVAALTMNPAVVRIVPTVGMTNQAVGYYEGQLTLTIGGQIISAFDPVQFYIGAAF